MAACADWTLEVARGAAAALGRPTFPFAGDLDVSKKLIRKEDVVVLLLDHQTGLMSLVRDYGPEEFLNNLLALAQTVKAFDLPTILATSVEEGANGPIVPQLPEILPGAPIVRRAGEINAWDNPAIREAVIATGRRQVLIAGIVTEVCVAMPALSLLEEGFEVFVVTDASGTFTVADRQAAHLRMTGAGVQLLNWFAVACELQRDWRDNGAVLASLMGGRIPDYGNLIASLSAQQALLGGRTASLAA